MVFLKRNYFIVYYVYKNTMKQRKGRDDGFTGLETAIILITFVVVASTLGYVVINSGIISTQKTGQVVQNSVQQAESTIGLGGTPVAQGDPLGTQISSVDIYLENQYASRGINVDSISYVVSDSQAVHTMPSGDARITTSFLVSKNNDRALDKGELAKVTLNTNGYSLTKGKKIAISIQPPEGNALVIERTLPDTITANKHYELLS